jgi:hypothetical protein
MTARMIAEELGLNRITAASYFNVIGREDGIERDQRTGRARNWSVAKFTITCRPDQICQVRRHGEVRVAVRGSCLCHRSGHGEQHGENRCEKRPDR